MCDLLPVGFAMPGMRVVGAPRKPALPRHVGLRYDVYFERCQHTATLAQSTIIRADRINPETAGLCPLCVRELRCAEKSEKALLRAKQAEERLFAPNREKSEVAFPHPNDMGPPPQHLPPKWRPR